MSKVKTAFLKTLQSGVESRVRPPFSDFCVNATDGKYVVYDHLEVFHRAFEEAIAGTGPKDIMAFMPPRHGKSMTANLMSAYCIRYFPRFKVIAASHTEDLAYENSGDVQDYFQHSGGVYEHGQKRADKGLWETIDGSSYQAVGVAGSVTGFGGHMLILDDPVKDAKQAQSPRVQLANLSWYMSTFSTRENNVRDVVPAMHGSEGAIRIIIQTLWSEQDIPEHIIRYEKEMAAAGDTDLLTQWRVIWQPAIKLPYNRDFPKHFMVDIDFRQEEGEPLCRHLRSAAWLKKEKAKLDHSGQTWVWQCLFLNDPKPAEGTLVKRSWFYDRVIPFEEVPPLARWFRPWDLAFTEEKGSNRTVSGLGAVGVNRERYFMPDTSIKANPADVKDVIEVRAVGDEPDVMVGIESKHSGIAIISELRRAGPMVGRRIHESKPHKSKAVRASNWITLARAGKFYLVMPPKAHPVLADSLEPRPGHSLIDEVLTSFTDFKGLEGDFDDWVDCVSIFDEMVSLVHGREVPEEEEINVYNYERHLFKRAQAARAYKNRKRQRGW